MSVELCVIAVVTVVVGLVSLQMYRVAKPAPPTSRFDGAVVLDAGNSPQGATWDELKRAYFAVRFVVGSSSRDTSGETVITLADLLSRDIRITLVLGYLPRNSAVSVRLTGDARLVPESVAFDSRDVTMRTGTEDGVSWQEFTPVPDRGVGGEADLVINGVLVAPPVVHGGAEYDARMPTCESHGPGWVIGGGQQMPQQSCMIWFGETDRQLDLVSAAPELTEPPIMRWEQQGVFGREPAPRFRLRDRDEADRLDLLFYLSSGLLGVAGAGLFEMVLLSIGLLGMARKP